MGIRCADHVTPLYPQKLALTSPTGGGRSVGIVLSLTKATEFKFKFKLDNKVFDIIDARCNHEDLYSTKISVPCFLWTRPNISEASILPTCTDFYILW